MAATDTAGRLLAQIKETARAARRFADVLTLAERDDWPVHQPGPAWEAPIPGVHWYGGCDPDRPRVNPATGLCEGCGGEGCPTCGRETCPDHDRTAA